MPITLRDAVSRVTHSFIAYTGGRCAPPVRGRLDGVPVRPSRRRRDTSLAVRLLVLQGVMDGVVVLASSAVAYR